MVQTCHFSRTGTGRIRAVCFLVAVVASGVVGCRESGRSGGEGSITTTGEQSSRSAAVDPAKGVEEQSEEQSVVPYSRAEIGALEVKSIDADPVDWFDVLQDGKRAIPGNPTLLNSSIELPPGSYVVDVNRTQRPVTIEAGKKTILWTGNLVVEGQPSHAFWYPMQGDQQKLSSNPALFNSPRALFPGSYTVFINVSVARGSERLGEAEVRAGQKTVLRKE